MLGISHIILNNHTYVFVTNTQLSLINMYRCTKNTAYFNLEY